MSVQLMAAEAALRKMLSEKYFSICAIDRIIEMLSLKPDMNAYAVLHTLHCVDYSQMDPELLEALPELIQRVLHSPALDASRVNVVLNGTRLKLVQN